ncbi:diguanylate cyclase [Alkalimonas mucilaginosa]|uniref:diguanylate cyclase n=1 Tax=Alkalimonas mucilaginosa TaxID=3057676 RepID=A0ABU7JG01_9GAMM|nr:diguanylate cyclase [Alkalimonas sp. MEB004]MEE2024619.1 diguanylate cyclase [Alkalimonas sp. MEB004]
MPLQDDLKQQLEHALKTRKQLEDTYESQFKILAKFVSRLSLACKGLDIELDNKLAKLRLELARGTDLEKLLPLVQALSEGLKHLESKNEQDLRQLQLGLNEAGQLLQKQRGLPDQLRRDLRALLAKVNESSPTVHAYLPHLTDLARLYQNALQAKQTLDNSENPDNDRYGHICRQISVELTNLLSEMSFAEQFAADIDRIRQSLMDHLGIEELLNACLSTITIIVASINAERQSAQHFLLQLHDTLEQVQKSLVCSLSQSTAIQAKLSQLNHQLGKKIDAFSKDSTEATSLEQLKALVNQRLQDITGSLSEREQLEKQERELMVSSLKVMEHRLLELESEAQQFQKKLAEQKFRSLQDALTEIPNRAAFDERFELELKRYQRYGTPLCIALGDVDHFKSINDNYGHSAGDKTLKVIARALKQSLRETDFIARYGGEEFIILFPETSLQDLEMPLNNLRQKIKKIPFKFKNKKVPITISFGATQLAEHDTVRAAFDRADEALYEAKHAGRDKVILKIPK